MNSAFSLRFWMAIFVHMPIIIAICFFAICVLYIAFFWKKKYKKVFYVALFFLAIIVSVVIYIFFIERSLYILFLWVYLASPFLIIEMAFFLGFIIVYLIRRKKYSHVFGIVFVALMVMFMLCQSDFIKSRKKVDEDWMLGKTEYVVKNRYSDKNDGNLNQDERIIVDDKDYHFCVREIFEWNSFNNTIYGELYYYVHTDDTGRITDVVCYQYGGDAPYSEYRYLDRW